jgi:hypothetical protein
MSSTGLPRVGAPVVEALSPREGTTAARFHEWITRHQLSIQDMLERLTARWAPLASFVEANFLHPEFGPAGALVLATSTFDVVPIRRRVERLRVIPFGELADYIPLWEEGRTVAVAVRDMPDPLARRYATTPIRWSLNVPVQMEGTWVGLVGAATDERGFTGQTVAGFEAMARVLMLEFAADAARYDFDRAAASGNRFLQLLP